MVDIIVLVLLFEKVEIVVGSRSKEFVKIVGIMFDGLILIGRWDELLLYIFILI